MKISKFGKKFLENFGNIFNDYLKLNKKTLKIVTLL